MALLSLLNDETRSDARQLGQRLQMLPLENVEALIQEILQSVGKGEFAWKKDPLTRSILKEVLENGRFDQYRELTQDYLRRGIEVIPYWDPRFPEKLRPISAPPLLIYIRGSTFPGLAPIAIVGTRRASEKGLNLSFEFAQYFAGRGRTVVSGLALGIDSEAHRGALDGGGTTIAVLPGHVEHVLPRSNADLAQSIEENGALVSEVSRQAQLHKGRYIERNRITSGLSDGVVVVECVGRGGSLHQAKFAIAQGRPTYVVDQGTFDDPAAEEGFRRLRNLGAVPVARPEDLQESLTARS